MCGHDGQPRGLASIAPRHGNAAPAPSPFFRGLGHLALSVALSAASASGCSLVLDADSHQCDSDADCAARGARFTDAVCEQKLCVVRAGPLEGKTIECVAPESNGRPTVKYSFAIQLPTGGGSAAAPFRVQACQQFDVDCQEPVAGPFEVPAGTMYDFELPQGFSRPYRPCTSWRARS